MCYSKHVFSPAASCMFVYPSARVLTRKAAKRWLDHKCGTPMNWISGLTKGLRKLVWPFLPFHLDRKQQEGALWQKGRESKGGDSGQEGMKKDCSCVGSKEGHTDEEHDQYVLWICTSKLKRACVSGKGLCWMPNLPVPWCGSSAPRTVRNQFPLFINYSFWYFVKWQQQTETLANFTVLTIIWWQSPAHV